MKQILQMSRSAALLLPLCSPLLANGANGATNERPNILVLSCEDISFYLGCFGDEVAVSPNLDKFAENAIRHTHMFTCVGVSAPSRYSLITGRYATNDGANYMRVNYFDKSYETVPPPGVKCYSEYMREAGYYCTNNWKADYQFNTPRSAWDEIGQDATWENAPEDQPIFAIFNFTVSHESQVWKRANEPLTVDPNDIVVPEYFPDTETVRHDMAIMYSNVTEMDRQFQEQLDKLEKSGRADNTIVIFFSDNGGPLPRGKREILDSGTRVPFMIRMPDREGAGSVTDQLNMFIDMPATILSLAGVEIPDNIMGEAMYGAQKEKRERKYVYGATDRFDEQVEKRGSIRDERYLYVYNYMPEQSVYRPVTFRRSMPMMVEMEEMYAAGKLNAEQRIWFEAPNVSEALYDCEADPHQLHNIAGDKKYASILKRMRKAYQKEWIEPYCDKWVSWEEDKFIAERMPNGTKLEVEPIEAEVKDGVLSVNNDRSLYSVSYIREPRITKNSKLSLYTEPIEVKSGESVTLLMERIGYVPATKSIVAK